MRIYLDNCTFNRPFDDQSSIRIRLESEAKLHIQEKIKSGEIELVWSYILDFENEQNPFDERKNAIKRWKGSAITDIIETPVIINKAKSIQELSIKSKDALHIACAIEANADYFLTTDDLILKKLKNFDEITVINPLRFIENLD